MAKGLPYFKFTPTEWITGDINFESFELQGLFISICALYWQRDGEVSIEDLNKRFKREDLITELTDRFFSVSDGFISVKFLDEQLTEGGVSMVNSENGKKGGRPKTVLPLEEKPTALLSDSELKAKKSQEEEEQEKEVEKKKKKNNFFDFENENEIKNEYKELIKRWLEYKKTRSETYKNRDSILTMYRKLIKFSKDNPKTAFEIIDSAIGNNYSGFFEPKPQNGTNNATQKPINTPALLDRDRRNDES